ncbi:MAG: 6-phosphogluconolactonase [Verrucomicrobiales bacterium]|nr:6-phosphogluconolactonase [Verrucomicrobiales bacterium]
MKNLEWIPCVNAEALAEAAARRWIDVLAGLKPGDAALHIALSGGRTAGPLFGAVVALARQRRIVWERVHFFWADERCVPPDHAESNFRLARARLLEPLNIAPNQIHRIRGEAPPADAAAEASAELGRVVRERANGQPVLDLVLLGMGEDGHVASLFPGVADTPAPGGAPYRAVIAPKPPPARVTLDYGPLAVAREVWVLVSGSGKADALRASLGPDARTPLARVIQARARTVLFSDVPVQ